MAPTDMAMYMRRRRRLRRIRLIRELGGVCVDCGTDKQLEFDHRDPTTKLFVISSGLDKPWAVLWAEAEKCDLRCNTCHLKRTVALGHIRGGQNKIINPEHGTAKRYGQGCKCFLCRLWKHDYRNKRVDSRGRPLSPVV